MQSGNCMELFYIWGMNNAIAIPAEIKNDELYDRIITTIRMFSSEIKTVLEVGASSGDGSTEALIIGMSGLHNKTLYTIEANPLRYENLVTRYKGLDWVKPLNGSSVAIEEYMSEEDVEFFYKHTPTQLNEHSLDTVLSWYEDEVLSIAKHRIPTGLIDTIEKPDMVLLDGSAFTGSAEYQKVCDSKIIILDDILDIKHYHSHQALRKNKEYECLFCNLTLRNGYSIWVKRELL
jgi:hypothetical protein